MPPRSPWGPTGPGIGPTCTIRRGDWKLVYYYEDGAEPQNMNATYSNGIAKFTTNHNSLYGIVMMTSSASGPDTDPEPTPGDDDEPGTTPGGEDEDLPPVIRPGTSSSTSDDDTVTIVACAAAAAVAAILAVFLIMTYRKD